MALVALRISRFCIYPKWILVSVLGELFRMVWSRIREQEVIKPYRSYNL